jgi:hypothetical protein
MEDKDIEAKIAACLIKSPKHDGDPGPPMLPGAGTGAAISSGSGVL